MLRRRIIPCLQIDRGRLVKTTKFKNPAYLGDPVNAVRIFNQKEVDEVLIIDIRASLSKTPPPFEIIETIASECFMPMSYGGGIRNLDDMHALFRLGVEKIVINSAAFTDPMLIRKAAERFGSQAIVFGIDVGRDYFGRYRTFCTSGRRSTGYAPDALARKAQELGAGEILLTSIDREGTWRGYDIDLVKSVTSQVNLPVIACGGAGSNKDLASVIREGNASGAAAGSFFVYQSQGMGVLIKFPSPQELEAILGS